MAGKTAKASNHGANAIGFSTRAKFNSKAAVFHFCLHKAKAAKIRQAEIGKFVWPLLIAAKEAGTASRTIQKKAGAVVLNCPMGWLIFANFHNPHPNRLNPMARQRISPKISGLRKWIGLNKTAKDGA